MIMWTPEKVDGRRWNCIRLSRQSWEHASAAPRMLCRTSPGFGVPGGQWCPTRTENQSEKLYQESPA
ncbi:Uncharacterized protein DAT39_020039 [Clarias magur]|uniref:Uncharacterized protein n=1 Tax=Clarias magur TaxID=1594786 RepID=A0A8J4WT47_CLAMG|nr:Uncharacterized protein DAT39_020039 [Clarias magur]